MFDKLRNGTGRDRVRACAQVALTLAVRRVALGSVAAWVVSVTASAEAAGPAFTDVTALSGINYVQKVSPYLFTYEIQTGGAAARDFDGDGWTDLVVSRFDNAPILYRNVADASGPGGRRFVDVTAGSGLGVNAGINGLGWADIDRDGRPDLYATSGSNRHFLFMNKGNGKFVEEAALRNADLTIANGIHGGMSVSYGDYNRDGYADIAVGNWSQGADSQPNSSMQLLRNRGAAAPGHFDVTTYTSGIDIPAEPDFRRFAFTPRFADLDNDGWQDLAVSSDGGHAKLWWNNKDGTFTNGTQAANTGTESAAMGNTVADFDRDGDLDWVTTSIGSIGGNRLYRNRLIRPGTTGQARVFSDGTDLGPTGIRQGGWGWGASFLDYDLDGWQDLIHTNGQTDDHIWYNDRTRLFRNVGATGAMGFDEVGIANNITDTLQGKGLLVFDYDNDGAPDVFIVNNGDQPILYRNNNAGTASFLKLILRGNLASLDGSNPDAYGAIVTLSDAALGSDMMLEVSGSSNFLGQNDPALLFGLGAFTGTIDTITIRWPNGGVQYFHDVSPNLAYWADEGAAQLMEVGASVPEPVHAGVLSLAATLLLRGRRRLGRNDA
jgi:hypothetical protein